MQILVIAPGKKQTFACRRLLIWQFVNTSRGRSIVVLRYSRADFHAYLLTEFSISGGLFGPIPLWIALAYCFIIIFVFFIFTCPNAKSDKNKFGEQYSYIKTDGYSITD